MSLARPAECVFCVFSRAGHATAIGRRRFHASPGYAKRKPRHPSVKTSPEEIDVNLDKAAREFSAESTAVGQQYSPAQRAAIEAAQKLIDMDKLQQQSGYRTDPWRMKYFDDLSKVDPTVDKPVQAPWTNIDDNQRMKTDDEIEDDLVKFMRSIPEPRTDEDDFDPDLWDKFDRTLRLTVGREEAERRPRTALAPALPNISPPAPPIKNPKAKKKNQETGEEGKDEAPSPGLVRLMQMTGYSERALAQLRVKTIVMHAVANQTRLGKIRKMYCLSVAGNSNGLLGVGEAKGVEIEEARVQSQYRAIRNMQPILRYEDRTIYGDVDAKVSATELELYARPPGFGLRCQQYIWEICKCAGISDLAAKVTRARNPMNTVKATVKALLSQKDPEDIARARGKKLVDVRKVYYAGQT